MPNPPKSNGKNKSSKGKSAASKATKGGRKEVERETSKVKDRVGSALAGAVASYQLEAAKAAELAKSIACPSEFPAFRIQDGYSSFPTVANNPFLVEPTKFSSVDGATQDTLGIPADESFAVALRDPRRALIYYEPNTAGAAYAYRAVIAGSQTYSQVFGGQGIDPDYWLASTNYAPHGPKLYMGETASEGRWTPGTKFTGLGVSGITPATATTTIRIALLIGEEVRVFERTSVAVAGEVTSLFSVYTNDAGIVMPEFFHFKILWINQTLVNGAISMYGATGLLAQRCLPDYDDVAGAFEKMRFNALNLMFSNTAAGLYRNGYAVAWQVPGNMSYFNLLQEGFDEICQKPRAVRMEVTNGIHIFWKFTNPGDVIYTDVGAATDGDADTYSLEPTSDYLVISLKIPVATGRAGYWSLFSCVESRTDSLWFGDGFPETNRSVFEKAVELLARVPQVHENPLHIKDIFNWIKTHKTQIGKTITAAGQLGGLQAQGAAAGANRFLDIWF